ncbi:23285_t:CDS:1, partial [Racocetra persica]
YIHSQNISTQDQQSSTSANVLQLAPAIVEGRCTGQSLTPANVLQMTPAIAGEYGTVRQTSTSANVLQMTPAIAGECCIECCPVAAAEAAQAAVTMRDSGPIRDSESNNTDHTANEFRHSSYLWTAQDFQHG